MPNYFARVELHGAEWPDDYEDLHKFLARIGFIPCLTYSKGESAKLPTGFYFAKGLEKDTVKISNKVFDAADLTGFDNEVTVIQSAGSNSRLSKGCDC
jgi:hypothetical protein